MDTILYEKGRKGILNFLKTQGFKVVGLTLNDFLVCEDNKDTVFVYHSIRLINKSNQNAAELLIPSTTEKVKRVSEDDPLTDFFENHNEFDNGIDDEVLFKEYQQAVDEWYKDADIHTQHRCDIAIMTIINRNRAFIRHEINAFAGRE